jgi:hypothetical protein
LASFRIPQVAKDVQYPRFVLGEVVISKGGGRMETRKYRDAELVCQAVASDGTWLCF